MKALDLTNKKFGRLTAIERVNDGSGRTKWLCQCDCGNTTIVATGNLTNGHTRSCGCFWMEEIKKNNSNYIHGMSKTRLHKIWSIMIERCYLKSRDNYRLYGGRGITVCDEWKNSFVCFRDWAMENGYSDELSIDRIDPDGNYEPSNCRWATMIQQGNNRRNNHRFTLNGETLTATEWARRINASSCATIFRRLDAGWSLERALTEECHKKNRRK